MTPNETLLVLKKAGKPIVRSHFYRLTGLLGIRPLGSSRPQQYPEDTAARILGHLGISGGVVELQPTHRERAAGKLISVRTLRAARPKQSTKGVK